MRLSLYGNYDTALYLRRACMDASTELACNDDANEEETRRSELVQELDPGEYFVFVDGYKDNSRGQFMLNVTAQAAGGPTPVATDAGVPTTPETSRVCAGAVSLQPNTTVQGATTGRQDSLHASCAEVTSSPDQVYALRLEQRSHVRVELTGDYDTALYLRSDCAQESTELACNDDLENNRASGVELDLDPGTYYVVVDGYAGTSAGNYALSTRVTPIGTTVPNTPPSGQGISGRISFQKRALTNRGLSRSTSNT